MKNENIGSLLLLIAILVAMVFILIWFRKKFKRISLPCVFFVSGAVKSGKTLLSVHLAIKEYKRALLRWKFKKWIVKMFFPKRYVSIYGVYDEYVLNGFSFSGLNIPSDYIDMGFPPMLYSNIPLSGVRFNKLTIDIIEQKVRIPCGSIVLIDEISLFADSQLFKDKNMNNILMRFFKLFGHYSHNGKLIIDSQSIADNHFSLKRCMSSYLYIQDRVKYPFFSILHVREMIYSEDGSAINVVDKDLELDLVKVLILNSTYNKYDSCCLSVFTDYLPYQVNYETDILTKHDSLKCECVVTLNDFVKKMNEEYAHHLKEITLKENVVIDENGVVSRKED